MKILATICITLFIICAVQNGFEHNLSAVLGWSCAAIWVFNWFLKVG